MRSHCILSKNCSIHGENREISGPYNFSTPVKRNTSDVWNLNFWTFLGSKIEVEEGMPTGPPVATPMLSQTWKKFKKYYCSVCE